MLLPFHPLTNVEIDNYYVGNKFFKGTFARDRFNKRHTAKQHGAYVFNLEEMGKSGSHWVCLIMRDDNFVYYFDSFGVTHVPIEISKFIGENKEIIKNDMILQDLQSVMCGYYCIAFIDFVLDNDISGLDTVDKFCDMFTKDTVKNEKIIKNMFM